MEKVQTSLSSLTRFKLTDEHLITDDLVIKEITSAFETNRCYSFSPDKDLVSDLKGGASPDSLNDRFISLKNAIFNNASKGDNTVQQRLMEDARLSSRIVNSVIFIHRAIAEGPYTTLADRRFVLVKERHGKPTLYHISPETTVISHIGAGPQWQEIPSIYLGLNIFDTLSYEQKKGGDVLYRSFKSLLLVEERAIETGFSHTEIFTPDISRALNLLVDEVIRISSVERVEAAEKPEIAKPKKFTDRKRQTILKMLDARLANEEMNFSYKRNLQGIESLERFARRYKRGEDNESLREIVKLLVAASGHDIHEIRNRANIALERIFSPKEFDAPLATYFINVRAGTEYRFELELPEHKAGYFLRIYENSADNVIASEKENKFTDLKLGLEKKKGVYTAKHLFSRCGHYDFLAFRKKRKAAEWVDSPGASGRVNVIPDVSREIILEIFPDIHGHTGLYWNDPSGHQGLVYNENGEVIQLGRFSDITAHLEDLQERYSVTALYLLGVHTRGKNREDWAPEATSPSPFSPMSMVEIEESLGGSAGFLELVKKAHSLGIKVIIDAVPHLNRRSTELPEDCAVKCYDGSGNLVVRASTDGRYGSWNDGKLLNYRMIEVWDWLAGSIVKLIEEYDIDGIRFDSAHAAPIMMKRNNYPYVHGRKRTSEEMVAGDIIVNDREDDHFITTGYYDSACRDLIGVPLHYYIMKCVEKKLREKNKNYFINIAECYWGHERFLARTGIIPYNSALFKICENIVHGKGDVREIYHIYDNYFPSVLPEGTEQLGILGNHDERRALNTFGQRGMRAAVGLTIFMSNIIMDYEGSSEGESWRVYLDNIYVNWNRFEYAAHRSVDGFYKEWYTFFKKARSSGYLIWANNNIVAAALRYMDDGVWLGAFNFSDSNQNITMQFDSPVLPIGDDACFRLIDPVFSQITGLHGYYTGKELKVSQINTVVSYTDRIKLLRLEEVTDLKGNYHYFLKDSFSRLCKLSNVDHFKSNFAFLEVSSHCGSFKGFSDFILSFLAPIFWEEDREILKLGLKRSLYHIYKNGLCKDKNLVEYMDLLSGHTDEILRFVGEYLRQDNARGPLVFISAEAMPFSKSGGLANVVYELPRELARQGEKVYVITGYYKHGDEKAQKRMNDAVKKYGVKYTGENVRFKIQHNDYEVGVHTAEVDGVIYFLLDHHEFFDGLYWGITSSEKLRRRVSFARACIELIINFNLVPRFTFSNDAYAGLFNGFVRCEPIYLDNPNFKNNTFIHVIHNGGWQYFDAFHIFENGFNLFDLYNLPHWRAHEFCDPKATDRLNCMAAGIRFADRVVTVSPSYARQVEFQCDGLEVMLRNVIGISNAIGGDFRKRTFENMKASGFIEGYEGRLLEAMDFDPQLKEKVRKKYPEILKGFESIEEVKDQKRRYILTRVMYKMMLQVQKSLNVDPDALLLSMIHRISEQKGFQLLLEASEGMFKHLNCQMVTGGAVSSGDRRGEDIAHGLYLLGQYYPGRVSVNFGFMDVSVPLFASDMFCMPSMNEPGGISQLEAFACGCLVIARATGGLRDTVFPVRVKGDGVEGNGFLFSDFNAWAFYDAVQRAYNFFKNSDDDIIYSARINAENSVSYWDRPAKRYIEEMYNIKEVIRII